jgi:hypothetical protein
LFEDSTITKNVIDGGVHFSGSLSSISPESFNYSGYNKAANLGLPIDPDGNILVLQNPYSISSDPDNKYLTCHKIRKVSLLFEFDETNPKYILSDDTTKTYVKLEDNYAQYSFFNPSFHASFNSGYFNPFTIEDQTSASGWSCKTYEAGASAPAACVSN